jgi:hypothetical protein
MSPTIDKTLLIRLKQMTTKWGIYQHSHLSEPDPKFGYALDDQARAFWIAEKLGEHKLANIYLSFMKLAVGKGKQDFQFYYDNQGEIIPDKKINCSEDALGMVGWVLMESKKETKIVNHILKMSENWQHLRSSAYLILGLTEGKSNRLEKKLIQRICSAFSIDKKWHWFMPELTYANALLPWALWKQGRLRHDNKSLKIAKIATNFLINSCQKNGVVMPIGCNGWYPKEGIKSNYDQQPVDAAYMICCLREAYLATNDKSYLIEINKWWLWFWGNNTQKTIMVNNQGACFDAVIDGPNGINLNQGAESTISFLMAYWSIKNLNLKTTTS